jgi:hypothetical protein
MMILQRSFNFLARNKFLGLYLIVVLSELTLIHSVSDLPSKLGNWLEKSRVIAGLEIPEDNFYGPGSAIMLIPFLPIQENLFLANIVYFGIGTIGFWKLTELLPNKIWRGVCLLALPTNFYLMWLVNSSQDTVFEFCLLIWSALFLVRKNYVLFSSVTYLLCLSRSGYWIFFLGTSVGLFFWGKIKRNEISWKKLIAVPLLILTSIFNFANYDSPSPALEGGLALYFSYTKYHYLSLPKMDMDVFLSGPQGPFSEKNGPHIPDGISQAEENSIYTKAGLESLKTYKKESVLGWMQKFDSYFFDVQKVPHLPGAYVLNQDKQIIEIQGDRLTWPLVLGNFSYMIWRTILILGALIGAGILFGARVFGVSMAAIRLWPLALPYLFGVVPGIIIYTETRFKIVSELLLVPLILEIWSKAVGLRSQRKRSLEKS